MPLVCVIKCQPILALLASAVLLCLSVSLCSAVPSSLGVFLLGPGVRIEIITAFNMKITVILNVALCSLV